MIKFRKDEIETCINIIPYEKYADVYSNYEPQMKRLKKLAEDDDKVEILRESEDDISVRIPSKYVKIVRPRKVSEEQRIAARERLNAVRRKTA